MDLAIVTFLWGDFGGNKPYLYLNRLYNGLCRSLNHDFRFITFIDRKNVYKCVGNTNPYIQFVDLHSPRWKKCLPKLYMYKRGVIEADRIVALDIDTIITGDVTKLFTYNLDFITCLMPRNPRRTDGGITAFNPETMHYLWDVFVSQPDKVLSQTKGRERIFYRKYIQHKVHYWQDLFPNKVVSYKRHIKPNVVNIEDTSLVRFHGKPKPHTLNNEVIRKYWI